MASERHAKTHEAVNLLSLGKLQVYLKQKTPIDVA